jgi:hypothetical protein
LNAILSGDWLTRTGKRAERSASAHLEHLRYGRNLYPGLCTVRK